MRGCESDGLRLPRECFAEMSRQPEKTGRDQAGRFAKGHSGNPAGKPPGCRHRATRAAEALLAGEAGALTRKAIETALQGDVAALRLCLERLLLWRSVVFSGSLG